MTAPPGPFVEIELGEVSPRRPSARGTLSAPSAQTQSLADRRQFRAAIPMRLPMPRGVSDPLPIVPSPLRSVHFFDSPALEHMGLRQDTSASNSPGSSQLSHSSLDSPWARRSPTLLGRKTSFRPLWLLGAANFGTMVFGMGEVFVQRAIWPAHLYSGIDPDGDTIIPNGRPGQNVLFGGQKADIAAGVVAMLIGLGIAAAAATAFLMDAQALARQQNPSAPNLRRPRTYYSAHLFGLLLMVGNRFMAEAFREYLPTNQNWLATVPGALGSAIFAVTQAQSFSSSELYNGQMPLKYRPQISMAARAGVASWVVLAALAGTPNTDSYLREAVKLVAVGCTTVAYSLPLTTARILTHIHHNPVPIGELHRPRGDWTAMQAFGLYALARFISAGGSASLERAQWPATPPPPAPSAQVPGAPSPSGTWRGLPPPLPNGTPDPTAVSEAALLMAISVGLAAYACLQLRKDALPRGRRYANSMFAAAVSSIVLGSVFRVMTENAKAHANFERIWEAMPVGFVANMLANVVIPELFAQSERTQGNHVIPYRYQVTEACRGLGSMLWFFWVGMSAIQFIPPLVRQSMVTSASLFSIMGFSLPDAQTRRHQTGYMTPGATPAGERPNPFEQR